jgi:magnesium transporter
MAVQWVEISSQDSSNLQLAVEALNVHPLALEDCLHRDQRPKLDDYDNHQLVVWFLLHEGIVYEMQLLIFPDQIIFVPHEPSPRGKTWSEFLDLNLKQSDVAHLLYHALDRMTDITMSDLKSLFSKIDAFEQRIFRKKFNPEGLLAAKKQLNKVDYSLSHLASVAQQLPNLFDQSGDLKWKFRDLYDHCERINRNIEMYRGQISTIIDLTWGLQANRTNYQIKKLSLLASVALPLTFWSAFWGMNFQFIPYGRTDLFVFAIAIMLISAVAAMWMLVRQGYWED